MAKLDKPGFDERLEAARKRRTKPATNADEPKGATRMVPQVHGPPVEVDMKTGKIAPVKRDNVIVPTLLSVTEAREILGCSRQLVYRMIEAGVLPHIRVGQGTPYVHPTTGEERISEGMVKIRAADLRDYLDNKRTTKWVRRPPRTGKKKNESI